ncbi:MAG TPA: tetratricopeptide repeat protein, partial [Flavisolibacter sp.]
MKRLLLICFAILSIKTQAQQSSIRGVVSIHNSETYTGKRQYVVNAQVEDDFKKATPAVTDINGQFELVYVGVPEKASVSFQVKKPSLQVVDPTKLLAIAGQYELARISMAHPDSIAEYRRRIFIIGKTEAEKALEKDLQKKNKELAELRKNSKKNNNKINDLEQELTQLEEQATKIKTQAEELARKYAPINLDDASPLFRKAFVLFQEGSLDSAQRLLKQANLTSKVDSILQERGKVQNLRKEVEQRDSIEKHRTKDVQEALQLKADIHKTKYEFDSASYCYNILIQLDSSDVHLLHNYAHFLSWLNQQDKAISYYLKALYTLRLLVKDNAQPYALEVAATLNNLGILYTDKNEFIKAEEAFKEALQIHRQLAKENPQIFVLYVATTQNNLGNLYSDKNDFIKAEEAFKEALQ